MPGYDTSDVLYLTGTTTILVGPDAASLIARTNLAVQVTITSARFVRRGLPFRGTPLEASPYNPPVRHLLSEKDAHAANPFATRPDMTAALTNREELTPSISRFTFTLTSEKGGRMSWVAGQHVTMDFSGELSDGYAHMRDEDPQSLNDDFVRTFTVSNSPSDGEGDGKVEVQITARRNGPATGLLWRWNLRAPLEVPVLGFGGEAAFRLPVTTADGALRPVFVAGGVGITPLLAQAEGVIGGGVPLELLWSLNKKDVSLAVDTFKRIDSLADKTTLFVSGDVDGDVLAELQKQGLKKIVYRRIAEEDVKGLGGRGRKFYLCTGPALLRSLQDWLEGENAVWEDFGY